MAATRLELNLMRLLSRCEALAAERRDPEEWRLEKVRRGPAFWGGRPSPRGGGGGDRPGKAGGPGALLSPQQRGSAARNKLRQRVLWSVKTSASLSAVRQPLPDRIFLLNAVA